MSEYIKDIKQSLLRERLSAFIKLTPGIVHNLSNPLTVIVTRAQLLQLKMPEISDLKKMIDQSKTIEAILNNLVFISQNISNDELQQIDINSLVKNEMEFLKADPFFKHNITKEFQYYPGLLMTTSSYFHISTLLFCIVQILLVHLKSSVENKINIITDKTSDSMRIRIGSHVLNHAEVNNFASSISSRSDNPRLQNLYDASLLAKELEITLMINSNPTGTEFTISIPKK
ncbi:hypothetical protein KJ762_04345 [bacterium]|nr:hypothetical protein [bacterium]MBU1066009.1 hypothetical protein [bacterium]MBU1633724.1 hypothetical protein [bacterium]MBU1875389.1 hypothetical protein [bacterium]